MVPGKYNITIHKGATWSISIEAKNAVGVDTDFSVYDSMRLQVSRAWVNRTDSKALLTLSTANGRITLSVDNETITLTLTAAETAALNFHEGVYEFELIKDATINPVAAEVVDRLLYGSVKVVSEGVA